MTGRDRIFESPVDKQEVKCNTKLTGIKPWFTFHFLFINYTFVNSALFKNNKKYKKNVGTC